MTMLNGLIKCVGCGQGLEPNESEWCCSACGVRYTRCDGRPVLLNPDNPLFSPDMYSAQSVNSHVVRRQTGLRTTLRRLKALTPSRSVNMARASQLDAMQGILGDSRVILVLGCGVQRAKLEASFAGSDARLVFADIAPSADVDVYCDGHDLPFCVDAFDGVITTAVLEHVLDPTRVVAEIHRVLRMGGVLYSEIPFLQSVHEGAYDFTRYTLSGHRYLLSGFREESAGMVAGPGTALVWALTEFAASLFKSPRLSQVAGLVARWLFFWIKYVDYALQHNPRAIDSASCTYFLGCKTNDPVPASAIITRYAS